MKARLHYLPYLALTAVCFIWGTTYLALRIGVLHFPPFLFTAIRQTTAGLLLAGVVLVFTKAKWPSSSHLLRQAVAGLLLITMGNGFVAWAGVHIPSGVIAIICSLLPVVVILINLTLHKEEKPSVPVVLGVILGLSGIAIIFSEHVTELSNTEHLIGILLTVGAVISWAAGSIWIKRKDAGSEPFVNAGLQMFFGGLICFPISLLFDDLSNVIWTTEVLYALLYLIVFGSIVAYASYLYALGSLPITIVSLYAYVNPVVAVILGWVVLNEKLNVIIWLAIVITVAGIYMVNRGYQLRKLWKTQFSKS